ncbi:MAG TPA: hypothetical protein V6C69_00380 [Trichormus sp.]|jgi:hypothetical protein
MSDEFFEDPERHKVWMEMSDLFLDSELTLQSLESTSWNLANSSFSTEELIRIYEDEVAPVLCGNLHCVGGTWGAFSKEEVIDPIRKRLIGLQGKKNIKGIPPIAAVRRWFELGNSEREWKIVLSEVIRLRSKPD